MPLYEYRCKACGHEFEDMRRSCDADAQENCPKCGKPKLQRLMSSFATGGSGSGGFSTGSSCGSGGFS